MKPSDSCLKIYWHSFNKSLDEWVDVDSGRIVVGCKNVIKARRWLICRMMDELPLSEKRKEKRAREGNINDEEKVVRKRFSIQLSAGPLTNTRSAAPFVSDEPLWEVGMVG